MNADKLDRFADKVRPGSLSELYGFEAIIPQTQANDWLERLTPRANNGQSNQGESNGEV